MFYSSPHAYFVFRFFLPLPFTPVFSCRFGR